MTQPAPTAPQITLAIATLGARAGEVQLPDPMVGLRYDIFIQDPPTPLPHSPRADVRYIALPTRGLSHSRNAALTQCQTPFLVFADDDMTLDTTGIRALAAELAANPALDFAAGWRAGRMPRTGRRAGSYRLGKLNTGRLCAPELMVRPDAVRAAGVTFDPQFGVGTAQPVGEDYIFVCDMLDAGLHGAAFAIVTGAHDGLSTGDNWQDTSVLTARRAVLTRCFGFMAPAARLAYVLRHRTRLGGWRAAWRFWTGRIKSA